MITFLEYLEYEINQIKDPEERAGLLIQLKEILDDNEDTKLELLFKSILYEPQKQRYAN